VGEGRVRVKKVLNSVKMFCVGDGVLNGIFPSPAGRGQGEGEKSLKFHKKCFV